MKTKRFCSAALAAAVTLSLTAVSAQAADDSTQPPGGCFCWQQRELWHTEQQWNRLSASGNNPDRGMERGRH